MEVDALIQKAQQAYEKGNYEYAIELLENLLLNLPSSHQARHLLHLAKQQQAKNRSSASKIINSFLTIPRLITVQIKDRMNPQKKDVWRMISAYEKVLSTDPDNTTALMGIASLLVAEKQFQTAVQTLQELLAHSPYHAPALKQLSGLYLQLGQPQKARECFEQILKIDPKNTEAERSLKNLDAMDAIRGMKQENP